jgi:hypothetical protein
MKRPIAKMVRRRSCPLVTRVAVESLPGARAHLHENVAQVVTCAKER